VETSSVDAQEAEPDGRRRIVETPWTTEADFRRLVESIADYAIFILDRDGRVASWNAGAERIKGYGRDEIIGAHVSRFYSAEDRAAGVPERLLERAAIEGRVESEGWRVRKDGSRFWANVVVTALRGEDGALHGFGKVTRNVTEQRQTDERCRALADAVARQARTVDVVLSASPDQFYMFDRTGRCLYASRAAAKFLDRPPGDLVGRRSSELGLPPEVVASFERKRESVLGSGVADCGAFDVPSTAGGRSFQFVLSPVLEDGGAPSSIVATVHEVTEATRAEREIRALNGRLEQSLAELGATNRELEAFSYSVSHDLRAPLRAVDGFARILAEDHASSLGADALHILGRIRESARHMGVLIDDLLAFSRFVRAPLSVRPVEMSELAREALERLRPSTEGRPIEFVIGELPPCEADPALLHEVWLNLLGNAIKFTAGREPARIEVRGAIEGDEAVYAVHDNGVGFDPTYAHKLFGVFQRLHRADEFEGTGVGLALVQRIVRRHGGRVAAEGVPGVGATFRFSLPVVRNAER
jgi:PAS domain S-box-containing protein